MCLKVRLVRRVTISKTAVKMHKMCFRLVCRVIISKMAVKMHGMCLRLFHQDTISKMAVKTTSDMFDHWVTISDLDCC